MGQTFCAAILVRDHDLTVMRIERGSLVEDVSILLVVTIDLENVVVTVTDLSLQLSSHVIYI